MSVGKKKGLFAMLFERKQSSCCSVKIEELPDDELATASDEACCTEDKTKTEGVSCCCGSIDAVPDQQEAGEEINEPVSECTCCNCAQPEKDG